MNFELFRYRGIPVMIHWSMLFGLVLYGIIGGAENVAVMCLALLSVIPHEFGHALVGRMYGIETHSIWLTPLGGVALLENIPKDPKKEIIITAAGPAVTFILMMWFGVAYLLLPCTLFFYLAWINFVLLVFNALILFPLDGGRIFRAILAMYFTHKTATNLAVRTSQVLCGLLGLTAIILMGQHGLPMAFIMGFLICVNQREMK